MDKELLKFVERAGDVLLAFSKQEKKKLKPPEEAAKELLESEKNLKSIESRFQANSIDIIYNFIKYKYPDLGTSSKAEKLLTILKGLSQQDDEEARKKAGFVYQQVMLELHSIESKIQAVHPEYKKKFV